MVKEKMEKLTRKQTLKEALSLENVVVTALGVAMNFVPYVVNKGVEWSYDNPPSAGLAAWSVLNTTVGSAFLVIGVNSMIRNYFGQRKGFRENLPTFEYRSRQQYEEDKNK